MATFNISVEVPDAMLPRVKVAFGGGTNAEVIAAARAWLSPRAAALLKNHVMRLNAEAVAATLRMESATNEQQATQAYEAEINAIDSAWP